MHIGYFFGQATITCILEGYLLFSDVEAFSFESYLPHTASSVLAWDFRCGLLNAISQ